MMSVKTGWIERDLRVDSDGGLCGGFDPFDGHRLSPKAVSLPRQVPHTNTDLIHLHLLDCLVRIQNNCFVW